MKKLSILAPAGVVVACAIAAFPSLSIAQADSELAAAIAAGQEVFETNCQGCHGDEGQGGAGPALAGNDVLSSARAVAAQILNGNEEHGMPAFMDILDDDEVAAVGTYIRNSWGNAFGLMVAETVAAQRP